MQVVRSEHCQSPFAHFDTNAMTCYRSSTVTKLMVWRGVRVDGNHAAGRVQVRSPLRVN